MRSYFLKNHTPVISYLELTLRCNHRCLHCYVEREVPSEAEELTREELQPVFKGLASLGALILVFTGGEIFLRPDLFDILRDARKLGFAVVLFTNGTHVTQAHAETLKTIAPLGIEISLHGADAAAHEAITGIPGSFGRALEGIRLLKAQGLHVKIKGNLMQSNQGQYEGLIALAGKLGADFTFDPYIFPCRDHELSPTEERLDAGSLKGIFLDKRLVKSDPKRGGKGYLEAPDNRLCGTGANVLTVSSNGDVHPCIPLKLSAGNVRKEDIVSIWRNSPLLKKLRNYHVSDLKACATCADKKYCLRCSALCYNETGDFLGCSELSRKISKVRRDILQSIVEP